MKKLIVMLGLVIATGVTAMAQGLTAKTPEQRATHMTRMLTKRLNLTADQATKINAIMLTRATRIDSLKANKSADNKKLNHIARKQIAVNTNQQVMAVLTPDQQKSFGALMEKMREKHKRRPQAATETSQG